MVNSKPIKELKGVGEKTAELYGKIGIFSTVDLLQYYPTHYIVFENPVSIDKKYIGKTIAIKGTIISSPVLKHVKNLQIISVTVLTNDIKLHITWFNMPFLKKTIQKGQVYIFRGILSSNKEASWEMEQPKYYVETEYMALLNTMQPVYSLTKKLTNQMIIKSIKQLLHTDIACLEFIPAEVIKKYHMESHEMAIRNIHFPLNEDALVSARRRLVFEEFFLFLLNLRLLKEQTDKEKNEFPMIEVSETTRLIEKLPYSLTAAQIRAWNDIAGDMQSCKSMSRLIQGDVGSGKTIIAILACIMVGINGYQSAFMAPTEVLAVQHYETVCAILKNYNIPLKVVLLTGSMTLKNKQEIYTMIKDNQYQIIIGTHALIQEKVIYHNLALAITDEQHRFGVKQRELLSQKAGHRVPHILVMSATPIPRTLGIILYGDLDVSVIDELPAERIPVKNCVVNTNYRKKAYELIFNEVHLGRQAYIICPMVEENETIDAENVMTYTQRLKEYFPETIQISYLHGKMLAKDKNKIMESFVKNKIQVLVSTTVIEVGVNVPNASVMLIENAERFGLSQLHQLRGRIGRGKHQSYCIFMSSSDTSQTMKRLEILNQSNDGFFIASEDLKTRGPGDFFGIRQSGSLSFAIGDVFSDADILQNASEAVTEIMKNDTLLTEQTNQLIKEQLNGYRHRAYDKVQL